MALEMAVGYVVAPAAQLDSERVVDYMAVYHPAAISRWSDNLIKTYRFLAQNPDLGHTRTDYTDKPVLFWTYGAYLVVYRKGSAFIEIVALVHGSRDIPAFLEKRLQ